MILEQRFSIPFARPVVWEALRDTRLVAECLPGASILESPAPNQHKGRFTVRLGPLAASFDGDLSVEEDPANWTAVVTGRGADARSSSRVTTKMTYRVEEEAAGAAGVHVRSDIALTGAMAQFGKSGVMQDVAGKITEAFVRNLQARLAERVAPAVDAGAADGIESAAQASSPGASPVGGTLPRESGLNAVSLLWAVLHSRLRALLGRMRSR